MRSRARRVLQSLSGLRRTLALVWYSGPGWTLASLVLIPIQGLLPLCTLYLLKLIVDAVAGAPTATDPGASFERVVWLVVLTAVVAFLGEACRTLARLARDTLSDLVSERVHDLLHAKSVAVDLESYERPDYYDALHRAHQETPFRPTRILFGLMMAAQNLILIVAISGWLVSVDWRIGLALFASVLPALWARMSHAARTYAWQLRRTPVERQASYFGWLLTEASVAKEIRLFDLGGMFARRFSELRTLLRRERFSLAMKRCVWDLATDALAIVAIFGSYGFIIYRAVRGLITVGDVAMFYQAFLRVQIALRELMVSLSSLYEDRLFLSTLNDFLELPSRIVAPDTPVEVPRPIRTGFAFHHVTFRYPGDAEDVLEDVSLEIRPNEVIALVGENGSGKTTLVKLLSRLYDPTSGVITLDGVDLREFDPQALRREIAVILQDYGRFSLSARENIWFGDISRAVDDAGAVEAAKRAGVHDAISRMPEGYDTVLGKRFEDGTELSVGEWQKLALARTFFHDAQLVVLDEPTSSMDAQAEFEVLRGFRERLEGAAAVLISHRLSSVRLADRILVLEKGRIAERGTHDELIALGGTYSRLFNLQARPYREDSANPPEEKSAVS